MPQSLHDPPPEGVCTIAQDAVCMTAAAHGFSGLDSHIHDPDNDGDDYVIGTTVALLRTRMELMSSLYRQNLVQRL